MKKRRSFELRVYFAQGLNRWDCDAYETGKRITLGYIIVTLDPIGLTIYDSMSRLKKDLQARYVKA